MSTTGRDARRYLRGHRHGVLSTISKQMAGYPFGSLAPFVLDHAAQPVILISRLAEHTKNIESDPRVSLLVHETQSDIQAAARLTLVGDAARVAGDVDALRGRYLNYFPDAEQLFGLGDFALYKIAPVTLRYIGGFGAIHWIPAADYAPLSSRLAQDEAGIIAHMNADHRHTLHSYCSHLAHTVAAEVAMAGIDCDGFDVRADGHMLRFDFEHAVTSAAQARQALVAMARQARPADCAP